MSGTTGVGSRDVEVLDHGTRAQVRNQEGARRRTGDLGFLPGQVVPRCTVEASVHGHAIGTRVDLDRRVEASRRRAHVHSLAVRRGRSDPCRNGRVRLGTRSLAERVVAIRRNEDRVVLVDHAGIFGGKFVFVAPRSTPTKAGRGGPTAGSAARAGSAAAASRAAAGSTRRRPSARAGYVSAARLSAAAPFASTTAHQGERAEKEADEAKPIEPHDTAFCTRPLGATTMAVNPPPIRYKAPESREPSAVSGQSRFGAAKRPSPVSLAPPLGAHVR